MTQRALISVSDKTGIVALAQRLQALQVEIISTGGTAQLLRDHAIAVIEVSDYTGFPEMMAGRLKTLHPKIHGGILGRVGVDEAAMATAQIPTIDWVIVNLYPFAQVIADPQCPRETAIENIDIGGPTLLRAAAKNHARVTVLVDAADYEPVLTELETQGTVSAASRYRLATKVFQHTAAYDGLIAHYLATALPLADPDPFPPSLNLQFQRQQAMRYGENPHQAAAFYVETGNREPSIATAQQLQGKELSYNNVADADAALECVKAFPEAAACVIVKHANPCGVALADDLLTAYQRAYATDPTSAFGGIIAFNRELDSATAQAIISQQFVEVIIAPSLTAEAITQLASKPNIRVLACGQWQNPMATGLDFKRVTGGLLVQQRDGGQISREQLQIVTQAQPDAALLDDLLFAWRVVKFVKSNAIVFCKNNQTIGIGAGQMSRVISTRIAAMKAQEAGLTIRGSVMASDAFFPFRDGLDQAAEVGIAAVIQPGGSMRDAEVIAAANERQMVMALTGMRHFRH